MMVVHTKVLLINFLVRLVMIIIKLQQLLRCVGVSIYQHLLLLILKRRQVLERVQKLAYTLTSLHFSIGANHLDFMLSLVPLRSFSLGILYSFCMIEE